MANSLSHLFSPPDTATGTIPKSSYHGGGGERRASDAEWENVFASASVNDDAMLLGEAAGGAAPVTVPPPQPTMATHQATQDFINMLRMQQENMAW